MAESLKETNALKNKYALKEDITAQKIATNLIADAEAKDKLKSEIGANVEISDEKINNAVNNALNDSPRLNEVINETLNNNTTFAKKTDITTDALAWHE